ncbi:MAG: EpsG family protein [Oscillospiraceae bacterium]|nr:EpsG family protein [Oscillospiraceae bacterium]
MGIYFLLFFVILMCSFVEKRPSFFHTKLQNIGIADVDIRHTASKKTVAIVLFMLLFTLAALRAQSVGIDLYWYDYFFREALLFNNFGDVISRYGWQDISFYALNFLISRFTNNFQIYLLVTSFIPLIIFFCVFYKKSKMLWLSVIIFLGLGFFAATMNLLRQIIAMAIIAIALKYAEEKKIGKFLLCVMFAASFHLTAVVCIPMYFFAHHKINSKNYIKYVFIIVTAFLFSNYIIVILVELYLDGRYTEYLVSGQGYTLLMILLGILIGGLLFKRHALLENKHFVVIYNLIFLTVVIQVVTLNFSLFVRAGFYYTFFLTLFIPNIINSIKCKYVRLATMLLTIAVFGVLFVHGLVNDVSGIVPFTFFWQA